MFFSESCGKIQGSSHSGHVPCGHLLWLCARLCEDLIAPMVASFLRGLNRVEIRIAIRSTPQRRGASGRRSQGIVHRMFARFAESRGDIRRRFRFRE